jgi:hypothetical protein
MNIRLVLDTVSLVLESTIFCAWIVASVLVYVPSLKTTIRRRDLFALVPQWNFFAPHPAQHDFYLLYHDQLQDGSITEWTEVASFAERPSWSIVWNPWKRTNKALFDAVTDLARHVQASMPALELSIPYLTLLNYISGIPRFGPTQFTQFLVMRSGGSDGHPEPELFYLSQLHSILCN